MTYWVDAGYYSYYMGSKSPFAYWFSRLDDYFLSRRVFLMDSSCHPSVRALEFPYYKGRRVEQRQSDPRKQEMAVVVREFRMSLETPLFGLRSYSLYRYEADDLMALVVMGWAKPGDVLVAIDKDYAQLPAWPSYEDALGVPVDPMARFMSKLPAYAFPFLEHRPTNRHLAIYQALVGDRSDSIPRILPLSVTESRVILRALFVDKAQPAELFGQETLEAFYTNLRLVSLPHPSLLWGDPSRQVLYTLLFTGEYDSIPTCHLRGLDVR